MKILFLDIDGVLNNTRTLLRGWEEFDEDAIQNLGDILRQTRARIVLSSTWRKYPTQKRNFGRMLVKYKLIQFWGGDTTPIILGTARAIEIQQWLDENANIERFAILDDDMDAAMEAENGKFFRTNYQDGLTQEIASKVIAFLNDSSKQTKEAE